MTRGPAKSRASVASRPGPVPDDTDRVIHQWAKVRPDLDVSSVGIISRLNRLVAIIAEEQEAIFAEHGISNPTFTMLVTLVRINQPGGVSQRRLASEMGLTPGTVSARVDRLVADGLVARSPDPADKRGSLVTLTDRGRDLFEAVVPAHLANQVRLLGSLTPDEQGTLTGLLRKLLVAFEGSAELESLPVRLGLTLAPVHVTLAMQRAVGLPERPGLLVRSAHPHRGGRNPAPVRLGAVLGHLRRASGRPARTASPQRAEGPHRVRTARRSGPNGRRRRAHGSRRRASRVRLNSPDSRLGVF